ncbi:glycosyltransferase family 2 protein [Spirochaetota bacterium]
MKTISIIIPCFNEEENLPELFKRLSSASKKWKYKWEVLCIDDGSFDRTSEILQKQNKKDKRWKLISLSRNFGHQTAISCGINYAIGDAVIIIDADLQDPPEELHRFIKKWEEGYHVVYAIRKKRKENILKKLSYWIFYRLMAKLVDFDIPLDSGDFSIIDRKVVNVLKSLKERNKFVRGLRSWSGFKQIGLECERHARFAGEPKYTFRKLLKLALDGILSFSAFPLKIATYAGLIISFLSSMGLVFTLVQRIFRDFFSKIGLAPVPGYATIVILILFLGGIQLLFLGIIGNYISRIFDEVKARPSWVIEEMTGIKEYTNAKK